LSQGATEVLLRFGMGVEIDASTDGVKLNNERGGGGGNPAEEAQALMNGAYAVHRGSRTTVPLYWASTSLR
jgi:hypothetical protein